MKAAKSLVGIDTGGTFTDFIWTDANGQLRIHKQLSTPDDPSRAVLAGLAQGPQPDSSIIHGSTVATNALLERRGAKTALITTAGFADVLAIGRQNRPDLYALVPQKPLPLVPSARRFEVRERVSPRGDVIEALNGDDLRLVMMKLLSESVDSVAICLLFSYALPDHEQRIAAAIRTATGTHPHISLSSEILPEYREFERTAATVINAYVAPLMERYLSRLAEQVAPRSLAIMQSNGGIMSAAEAGRLAAHTVLSGPAGGVVGARFVAADAGTDDNGFADVISFDMGGTSTDVALCPGRIPITTEAVFAGLPLRLPLIDIHTVGAGGGSLAHLDAGGALQVGPQSAGSVPGPACYHQGYAAWRDALDAAGLSSYAATVSDANLVLGRLDADRFLGGQMKLYPASARHALDQLARRMTRPIEAVAWDILRVANANMARAVRHISVERGYDPRRFTLVAFGGGGPLHACELADELGIPRVLIPRWPGVLSALGMLAAAPTRDYSRTVMLSTSDSGIAEHLTQHFAQLAQRARRDATSDYDPSVLTMRYGIDMRYLGQSHELTIDYTPNSSPDTLASRFHDAHRARYGYAREDALTEIVTVRLNAALPHTPPDLPTEPLGDPDATPALIGTKPVWFNAGFVDTRLFDRELLRAGHQFEGPAVVFQYDTTTVFPPDWLVTVDTRRNLLAVRAGR